MKFIYRTNIMGPYGSWWHEENNIPYSIKIINNKYTDFQDEEIKIYEQWYGGRIDIKSSEFTTDEIYLPIMSGESYSKFSNWLEKFSSPELKSFDELRKLFELEENHKLIIFDEINKIKGTK